MNAVVEDIRAALYVVTWDGLSKYLEGSSKSNVLYQIVISVGRPNSVKLSCIWLLSSSERLYHGLKNHKEQ